MSAHEDPRSSPWRGPLGVAFLLAALYVLVRLLGPILVPFVAAWILAYVTNPAVRRLARHGWRRGWATAVVLLFVLLAGALLAFILVPLALHQGERVGRAAAADWPALRAHLRAFLAAHGIALPDWRSLIPHLLHHWNRLSGWALTLTGLVTSSGLVLVMAVFDIVLVPLLTFYFLRDWDTLARRLDRLVPRPRRRDLRRLVGEADRILAGFFRGQLLVMAALAVTYAVGLALVGLRAALFVGLFAGLMSFVPYLGFASGLLVGVIAMLLEGGGGGAVLAVTAVFAVGTTLENFVYIPLFVGGRTRLHPLAVVFVLLAGGRLFGFLGILIAVPAAAVAAVFGREMVRRYRGGRLYRGSGGGGTEGG